MKTRAVLVSLSVFAFLASGHDLTADNKVIVHEWGTFTSLQDDNGQAIGGLNVDDEPVPDFVYNYYPIRSVTAAKPYSGDFGFPPYNDRTKGWQPADHDVTMRLETPVIYFYPPQDQPPTAVPPLEVHVDFHGGLLSQYYPYAAGTGFPEPFPYISKINLADCTSSLTWKSVRLGSTVAPVATQDKVWTTPREVGASPVEVMSPAPYDGSGHMPPVNVPQAEHFLFYRGIGHLDSPLSLQDWDGQLGISQQPWLPRFDFTHAWLAEIHADGSCSFVEKNSFAGRGTWWAATLLGTMTRPGPGTFSTDNLDRLKASMHDALIREGLYPDEASAMLRTWELSYFKSPGLRFFYIVPRPWVDKVLPLAITGAPVEITRVMVGRIELISPDQKAVLARLANGPCPNIPAIVDAAADALDQRKIAGIERTAYYHGVKPLSDLGIALPPPVQDYLSLGRFRDELILHEQQQHPTPALAQFIKENRLAPTWN